MLPTFEDAETLAVKIYRYVRISNQSGAEALRLALTDYQNPVPLDTMQFQVDLAIKESSDLEFIPAFFRRKS